MTNPNLKCTTRIVGVLIALGYTPKTLANDLSISQYRAKRLLNLERPAEYGESIQILNILRRTDSNLLFYGRDELDNEGNVIKS